MLIAALRKPMHQQISKSQKELMFFLGRDSHHCRNRSRAHRVAFWIAKLINTWHNANVGWNVRRNKK